jgi:hypothetical protein
MSVAVTVAAMDRVGLITASAAIRAGSMESAAAEATAVGTSAAEAAAVATAAAAAGKGATAAASTARIGADCSERQGARHEKYGYCSLD